ncbi:MAG: DUF362 domain-containing protein [Acidobacteria bacterium]|nr:MAG: DUF362 domain-containing protein [Acidobacteriota bacterium]
MTAPVSRRTFIGRVAAVTAACSAASVRAQALPAAPVAVARCRRYDFDLVKSTLATMFDMIGGIPSLVKGKTVTIKVNVTGGSSAPIYTLSAVETVYTHPVVVLAAASLFHKFGANRIVICESLYDLDDGRTGFQKSGYDVGTFESTVPTIEWENTRNCGTAAKYRQRNVEGQPYLYNYFMLNHRYSDTDVMVSIPKMKNHQIAGITLAMKNLFGITPSSLYSGVSQDEDSLSNRAQVLHQGAPSPAGGEILPVPSHQPGFRIPRAVVDIVRARPIDLSIIDAVVSMHGGEGVWQGTRVGLVAPGLLIAGRNCVCTDAVGAAIMGYDPEAPEGKRPFYNGANTLALAAARGLGSNRLQDIPVLGLSVAKARYAFLPSFKEGS